MPRTAHQAGPSSARADGAEFGWRGPLVGALLKVNLAAVPAGTAVTWLATPDPIARLVLGGAGAVALAALLVALARPRLGVRRRSLVLVVSYLGISLLALTFLGFIAGPVLMACAALLLARALLGRRALVVAAGVLVVGTALISWGALTGRVHWEVEAIGASLYDVAAWLRHVVVTVLLLGVVAVLVGYVVDAVEAALRDNARLLEDAQRAARLRDQFLSIASHELRTPLASLALASEGLTSGRIPATPENLARWLPLIRRSVDRLADLVGQLLDVSRIEAGRLDLKLEEVDLGALVREVAGVFALLPEGRVPLSLTLAADARGCWDRGRLEQVVVNLLTNAVRFGDRKPIEVSVSRTAAAAVLVVRDHGIGVTAEAAPHLFERAFSGDARGARGGLGLGLFIVHAIVTSLGGTVRHESFGGDGTSFIVELPLAGPSAAPAPATGEAP